MSHERAAGLRPPGGIESNGQILQWRLFNEFPYSRPRLVLFPAGSFVIEMNVRGKTYVIEYVAGRGYGLSKRRRVGYGWQPVDEPFDTLPALESGVRKLMTNGA